MPMNRTLTYPPEMAGFISYTTVSAHIESAGGVVFRAALGRVGDAFHVYVWKELPNGTKALVSVEEPVPNDAPSFAVIGGKLFLYGVIDRSSTDRPIVEREVPGYIDPLPGVIRTEVIRSLAGPSKVADAVGAVARAAVEELRAALRGVLG